MPEEPKPAPETMKLAISTTILGIVVVVSLELLQYFLPWETFLRVAAIPAIGILLFLLVCFIGRRRKTAEEVHRRVDENIKQVVQIELELDLKERREYANGLYYIVITWLLGITAFLLLDGFWTAYNPKPFLSDAVILALIGGTTINVLGLFTIVANYLFPSVKSSGGLFEIVANHLFPSADSNGAGDSKSGTGRANAASSPPKPT